MTTLLRLPALIERTGLSRSTIYERIRGGLIPEPIKYGARISVWPAHEIDACNQAVVHGLSEDERRALVKQLMQQRAPTAD